MKLHRFIGDFDLSSKVVQIKGVHHVKQIKSVLRLKEEEQLILYDGKGHQGKFKIIQIEKGQITCELMSPLPSNEPARKVSLYLTILKKENFELAVQKAVECGVSEIIPVISERTIKTGFNKTRAEKIILEATEQCGRTDLPTLSEPMTFKEALETGKHAEEKIIFDGDGTPYTPNLKVKDVNIFIGPEGGYTENEIVLAKTKGYVQASLGSFTLRGETAAVVATYRAVFGM